MINFNEIKHTLRKDNIALSMIDISSIREGVEKQGSNVYKENFTEWENAYADSMRFIKRRSDFVSGRLAGKEAVKEFFEDNQSMEDDIHFRSNEIEIRRMDSGEPAVYIDNMKSSLAISISHSGNLAISGVSSTDEHRAIGIDVEKIEHRDESFQDVAFRNEEIESVKEILSSETNNPDEVLDEEITRMWTIKESVLKSLGIGLNVDLKDIQISIKETGEISVNIKNNVMQRYEKLKGKSIKVESFKIEDYMLSVSFLQ